MTDLYDVESATKDPDRNPLVWLIFGICMGVCGISAALSMIGI